MYHRDDMIREISAFNATRTYLPDTNQLFLAFEMLGHSFTRMLRLTFLLPCEREKEGQKQLLP